MSQIWGDGDDIHLRNDRMNVLFFVWRTTHGSRDIVIIFWLFRGLKSSVCIVRDLTPALSLVEDELGVGIEWDMYS